MRITALLLFATLGLVAGCESISDATDSVREHWAARNAGRSHVYTVDKREAYKAAQASARKMGFRITKGGPAEGWFDALTGLDTDVSMKNTRQVRMQVRVSATGEGTELNVKLTEIQEDQFGREGTSATETPLRDTPYYEIFFRQVEGVVGKPVR